MSKQEFTADELVTLCVSQGYPVTFRKLQGWHKADLLPRPVVTRLGKGKGTASHYPAGTDRQLMALCRLHFRGGPQRRYHPLRVALWCEGFPVPLNDFKASALVLIQQWRESWARTKRRGRDKLSVAENIAQEIAVTVKRRGTPVSWVMSRFRSDADALSFWIGLIRLALGDPDALTNGDGLVAEQGELLPEKIIEHGFGLKASRTVSVNGAPPWLNGPRGDGLELLAAVAPHTLANSLQKASEAELLQAREDWFGLHPLVTVGKVLEAMTGADIIRRELVELVTTKASPTAQVMAIGFLLTARKARGMGPDIEGLIGVLQDNRSSYESLKKLIAHDASLIPLIKTAMRHYETERLSSELGEKLLAAIVGLGLAPVTSRSS